MSHSSPFAVLRMSPTRDFGAVKRAYFSALAAHPPQTDPAGFRLVRDAYELLSKPAALAAAFAAAPVDVASLERDYASRFDAPITNAVACLTGRQTRAVAVNSFVERFSRLSWGQALDEVQVQVAPGSGA